MPSSLLTQFRGELDTGWAEELRPVEHAALVLLADIADEVSAAGDDGLRFQYVACSGRRYRALLRINEGERQVMVLVFPELPPGAAPAFAPALIAHLNARIASGRFEQVAGERAPAFRNAMRISQESAVEAIRRLVDASTLPLELFEAAARRMSRRGRAHRFH